MPCWMHLGGTGDKLATGAVSGDTCSLNWLMVFLQDLADGGADLGAQFHQLPADQELRLGARRRHRRPAGRQGHVHCGHARLLAAQPAFRSVSSTSVSVMAPRLHIYVGIIPIFSQ